MTGTLKRIETVASQFLSRDDARHQMSMKSKITVSVAVVGLMFVLGLIYFCMSPANFLYRVAAIIGMPTEFVPTPDLAPGIEWRDDYLAVERLDEQTFAIAEPLYWQKNISYLIVGSTIAVLFDTGPGVRDMRPVVRNLTTLPVVTVASHLHYDHVGAINQFDQVAMLDLEPLRRQVNPEGFFELRGAQHLGVVERRPAPRFKVNRWLKPGVIFDLGGRSLHVLATPGHTPDSLMLYDEERRQLFVGGVVYPGALLALLPGADLSQYLATATALTSTIEPHSVLYPGHGSSDPGPWTTPRMTYQDLVDLRITLIGVRDGTVSADGFFPRRYTVNSRVTLWTLFPWNINWEKQHDKSLERDRHLRIIPSSVK